MASRKLEDLDISIQPLAARFISECRKQGTDILIYCTYRSAQEQAELYTHGRSAPGPVVTWTLHSKHNHVSVEGKPSALAFDCVPIQNGKALWNDEALYKRLGKIGESIGLTWGGRWKGKDSPHFEMP